MSKLVIVVDMQRDFITGPLGTEEAVKVRDNLVEYLKTAEYVIFTQDTHYGDYFDTQEGKKLPVTHCLYRTRGWDVDDELLEQVKDPMFVIKHSFGSIVLADYVAKVKREIDIDEIVFCGVCTDICVVSCALRLKTDFPEIPMSIKANCCAGSTPEKHKAALSILESCQFNIMRD